MAKDGNRPADVGLSQELGHADDMMYGKIDMSMGKNTGPQAGNPVAKAELRAVGLDGDYAYSENAYRKERGLPERTFY